MVDMAISATFAGDKPLSALADLLDKRIRWMGESARDAVVATAINCLVSLRAQTRVAKKPVKPKEIVPAPNLVPGWRTYGGHRQRCVRIRGQRRQYFSSARVRWHLRGFDPADLRCFWVYPGHRDDKPYVCVTTGPQQAAKYEMMRAEPRRRKYSKLAKWAFGIAMNQVSTRNVSDSVSSFADDVAHKFTRIAEGTTGDEYFLEITDGLDYAIDALKGGESDVNLALMKAANKTYGILAKRCGDMLGDDFTTPFPEVKGRRRGA